MKNYYGRSISSHKAEIAFFQKKGGDIAATWLANCQSENVKLVIKSHHVLTVSVSFGFPFREKKHPGQLSKPPETFVRRII